MQPALTVALAVLLMGVSACGPAHDPGPLREDGTSGQVLQNAKVGVTYAFAVDDLAVPSGGPVTLISASFVHVTPGLRVGPAAAENFRVVAAMAFAGDPRTRLPAGTYGQLDQVVVGPPPPSWIPLFTLTANSKGEFRATGLKVTYRSSGHVYASTFPGEVLGLSVTGTDRDTRLRDPIALQKDAP